MLKNIWQTLFISKALFKNVEKIYVISYNPEIALMHYLSSRLRKQILILQTNIEMFEHEQSAQGRGFLIEKICSFILLLKVVFKMVS